MFKRLFSHVDDRFSLSYDKKKYENILDDPNSKVGVNASKIIVSLVIISILVLVFESLGNISDKDKMYLLVVDFLISTVFAFEYYYRFIRARKKKKFVKHPLNIVDLLSFLPFFLGLIFAPLLPADILKVFKLIRVFRILKLAKHIPVIVGFIKALKEYKSEYKGIGILFLIVLTIFSVLVYSVEHVANPNMFSSIPTAFWWAIVTMTTVGYGDIVPITTMGKIIGSMLILLGPVLLAVLSAITILVFMDVVEIGRNKKYNIRRKECLRCGNKNEKISRFCMICGEKFNE